MTTRNGTTMGEDLGSKADARMGQIKDSVKGFVETAEERASTIKHRAIDAKDRAMTRGQALIERTADIIRANPLKSVGVAFGIGYVGMRLFRR